MPRPPPEGGRLAVLRPADLGRVHGAALELLGGFGLSEAPPVVVDLVCGAGGKLTEEGRLTVPPELVGQMLAGRRDEILLAGRRPGADLRLAGAAVHLGTGGAAPEIVEDAAARYRPSTLADLHAAARLVDRLEHLSFFSRPLVARDIADLRALDINTALAALAGTAKPVIASASAPRHVADLARIAELISGGPEAARARPPLALNINHVAPPMRFAPEAAEVLVAAARAGLPAMVNTFAQLGASSPVTIAGSVAQTHAETLAGMVVGWLANPEAPLVYGPRPMVTDLRTGAMAGGSGEQALATAAAVQLARHLGLACSTIAGATDSKLPDAQAGYEKALTVSLAAEAGANMVTQAAGMQAGLMAASFEAYVIDNEMCGAILQSLAPVEVSEETLSPGTIIDAIRTEGHFLGHPQTYARMTSDFLYPRIADRRPAGDWAAAGSADIREAARARLREILDAPPVSCLGREAEAALRTEFGDLAAFERMTA